MTRVAPGPLRPSRYSQVELEPLRGQRGSLLESARLGKEVRGVWNNVEPGLTAQAREGYVPNVVYTCGAMRLNDRIILPYAVCDTLTNFATIEISALLQAMVP